MGESLGDRVRAARQRKKWTLLDLSAKSGLSVPYLSDLERNKGKNPSLDALERLATALGSPISDFLGSPTKEVNARPLPISLQRFVRGAKFAQQLKRLSERSGRPANELEVELIDFLVSAPKRASGELTTDDWDQLLTFYGVILDK